jgi:uncharacterized protein (TIRG00374 family)
MTVKVPVALRLAVGVGAIGLLIRQADLGRCWGIVEAADGIWLLAALGAQLGSKLIWLRRWETLLASTGNRPGAARLLSLILIGLFFNNFLPTTVGGDVARGLGLARDGVPRATAMASVLADRVVGLFSLALTAVSGGILGAVLWPASGPWIASALFALGVAGFLAIFTRPRILARFASRRPARSIIAQKAQRLLEAMSFLAGREAAVVRALAYSLALAVFSALYHWSIGRALGITVPLAAYMIIVPAVMLSASLPITLGGLGIRELGFVGLLGAQGVPVANATVFALLALVAPMGFALLGGILFLAGGRRSGATRAADGGKGTP